MNTEVMHKTVAGSLAGTVTFPEVVRELIGEGVESYHADLVRRQKTFYMPDGETYTEKMDFTAGPIGDRFSQEGVVSALRDIQAGKDRYSEFLRRVMEAGTTSYTVFLSGRKAIYFGRRGEFHVEEFPGAK